MHEKIQFEFSWEWKHVQSATELVQCGGFWTAPAVWAGELSLLNVFSNLRLNFFRAYDMHVGSYVAKEFSRFFMYFSWDDEQNGNAMSLASDEHVIQEKLEHSCSALFSRYDLVQVTDHYIHFPFFEMVDWFPVSIPSIRDRESFNPFSCEGG